MKPFTPVTARLRWAGRLALIGAALGAILWAGPRISAQEATPPGFKAYRLQHAQAAEFGSQLRTVLVKAPGKPEVLVDRQLNRVLVQGGEEAHRLTAQLVKALDRPAMAAEEPTESRRVGRIAGGRHPLANISWREFEAQLRSVWGDRLAITASRNGELASVQLPSPTDTAATMQIDRVRGVVSLTGPPSVIEPWEKFVRTLDAPRKALGDQTQLVPIRRADPSQIQQAVTLIRAAMKGAAGNNVATVHLKGGAAKSKTGGELVSMIFQPRRAPGGAQEEPDPLLQPPPPPPPPPPEDPRDGGLIGPVTIELIEGLDVIVIKGHRRDVEKVVKMIEDIERESEQTKPAIEVYPLRHAHSQAMADLLTQIYDQVLAARAGRVSITPLIKPNSLLLIGRAESIDAVIELVEKLDRPVQGQTQFKVFQLKHLEAATAQVTLTTLYPGTFGGLAARVVVVAESRGNSLIVQAGPRDMAEVAALIKSIDVGTSRREFEFRVFKLKNAMAQDLAPVLQNAINGRPRPGAGGTGAQAQQPGQLLPGQAGGGQDQQLLNSILTFITVDSDGDKQLKSGILSEVMVTADARNNSLLVRAPAESMDLLAAIISQLDNLPAAEANIKVFTLVNGDATTLATMLQQLFGLPTTTGGGAGGQQALQALLQSATGSGESSLVALRFAVDQRTNSIIASGSAGDLNVVEAVLVRLDEGDIETRKTTVYRLKNAPAVDVANSINQLLTSQRQVIALAPNVVSPFERIEREVIVVPEFVSNSLIVSATPRFFDEIRRVVEQLDARPPMVMIQVLIAEVALNDVKELGVEIGLQDSLLFTRGIGTVGFPFNSAALGNNATADSLATRELLAGQSLSNLGVSRTNAALGYGGLVLSAGNESINLLLRALHDQQRVQILSRPQIMTLDNQPAYVQIGERVPTISGTTIGVTGTINTTTYVDVGILLGVTPRTSPDGLVVMEMNAEKSELGPEVEGIPISINAAGDVIRAPRIKTTRAQSIISAKSGQTVVFAGLITKAKTNITRRTPYLSDVPILGNLFRFDTDSERRTELLIIMTPFVVRGEEDGDWVKRMEADRMSWCLADVVEIHQEGKGLSGNRGPWGSQATPVYYPYVDPTGVETVPTPAPTGPVPPHPQLRPELLPSNRPDSSRKAPKPAAQAEPAAAVRATQPPSNQPRSAPRQISPEGPVTEGSTRIWYGAPPVSSRPSGAPARAVAPPEPQNAAPASFEKPLADRISPNYSTGPSRLPEVK